jgi:uncharacterized protein YndB with AHSA1/START domain
LDVFPAIPHLALEGHRHGREHGGGVEEGPMVLPAVEAVADPHPVRLPRRDQAKGADRMRHRATSVRKSGRELVVTLTIDGPARLVFEAWTRPELFRRWWVPRSAPITLLACALDVRDGGSYRLEFGVGSQTMAFFGRYLEVTPCSRLVWTNDEGGEDAAAITTVTFEERDGRTLLTVHDLHPTKEALDAAIASGSTNGMPESLEQLDELVVTPPR